MNPKVTVLIPCGGKYFNPDWLVEAVESVLNQTMPADEILIVDDGINLDVESLFNVRWIDYTLRHAAGWVFDHYLTQMLVWKTPWNLGFSSAFNCGIGEASHELIMYLASDDKLMPTAIEECQKAYHANHQKDAWYAMTLEIKEGIQTIPCNAAMITRQLFKWMGGIPPAAFVGPDAALLSILYKHAPDRIIWVKDGTPLYWVRDHPGQETKVHTWRYAEEMTSIRNKLTEDFKPQEGIVLR